jgi:hypothetical protein
MNVNRPPLNPETLVSLRELGPTVLSSLTADFRRTTPRLLADLRRAVEANDLTTVRYLKQSLLESSAVFGATALSDLCAITLFAVDLRVWLGRVETEYARVAAALTVE